MLEEGGMGQEVWGRGSDSVLPVERGHVLRDWGCLCPGYGWANGQSAGVGGQEDSEVWCSRCVQMTRIGHFCDTTLSFLVFTMHVLAPVLAGGGLHTGHRPQSHCAGGEGCCCVQQRYTGGLGSVGLMPLAEAGKHAIGL